MSFIFRFIFRLSFHLSGSSRLTSLNIRVYLLILSLQTEGDVLSEESAGRKSEFGGMHVYHILISAVSNKFKKRRYGNLSITMIESY
jgi:hypothetical protein